MLVLSRRRGEGVVLAQQIEVVVLEVRGNRVKLGVRGPASIPVQREELLSSARGCRLSGNSSCESSQ